MTKKYDIIHLNGFMYAVDNKPNEGSIYVRPKSPFGTIRGSLVWAKPTGLPGLYGHTMIDLLTAATNNPSLGLPLLPEIGERIRIQLVGFNDAWSEVLKHIGSFPTQKEAEAFTQSVKEVWKTAYLLGYKAASAKKYTEEDMRKAYGAGGLWQFHIYNEEAVKMSDTKPMIFEEFIKSLNPLPIAVEIEMYQNPDNGNPAFGGYDVPDVPIVDENNFVKVVKWIYEKDKKVVE